MMSSEEALDAWSEANNFSPKAPHWGFFAVDDSPFGVGGFTWFPTREAMLQFFWEIIPPAMANATDALVQKMMKEARGHVSRHEQGETTLEQLVEGLNDSLAVASQIQWVGTFGEMTTGTHRYCQAMRARFHARQAEGEADAEQESIDEDSPPRLLAQYGKPIAGADLKSFRDFLQEWGH